MDMNEFFTRCIPEDEQQRVQALEPFDEYEVILFSIQEDSSMLQRVRVPSSVRYLTETVSALQSSCCYKGDC